jgi:hypothetical protein
MDKNPLEAKHLTREHYRAFGRIVHAFVSIEALYAHIVVRSLAVDVGVGAFLLSNQGYDGLKNMLLTALNESELTGAEIEEVSDMIAKVNKKSDLRNNVSHCTWKPGRRPGSIKPLVLKTRGTLKVLGIEHNEKDWLVSELDEEADEILERGMAVGVFFRDRGVPLG